MMRRAGPARTFDYQLAPPVIAIAHTAQAIKKNKGTFIYLFLKLKKK